MEDITTLFTKLVAWLKSKNISSAVAIIVAVGLIIFGGIFAVIFGLNSGSSVTNNLPARYEAEVFKSSVTYKLSLEIARTQAEQEQGLMFRTSLPENSGMIFIFTTSSPRTFWMENTYVPLDIIYLDSDLKVVKIWANTKPNQTTEVYPSGAPIQYAIETNAGWASKVGLQVGDTINIPELL